MEDHKSVEQLGKEVLEAIEAGGASVGSLAQATQEQNLERAKTKLAIRCAQLTSIQNNILIVTNAVMIFLTIAILSLTYRMLELTLALTSKQ